MDVLSHPSAMDRFLLPAERPAADAGNRHRLWHGPLSRQSETDNQHRFAAAVAGGAGKGHGQHHSA
jgi:hypothetical protein